MISRTLARRVSPGINTPKRVPVCVNGLNITDKLYKIQYNQVKYNKDDLFFQSSQDLSVGLRHLSCQKIQIDT